MSITDTDKAYEERGAFFNGDPMGKIFTSNYFFNEDEKKQYYKGGNNKEKKLKLK